jgi:hypothetical protein
MGVEVHSLDLCRRRMGHTLDPYRNSRACPVTLQVVVQFEIRMRPK